MTTDTYTAAWAAGRAQRRDKTARTPVLAAVVQAVARRAPSWKRTRTSVYTLGGLGLIDYAVYEWNHLAGYAAAGLSLLILEWVGRE